MELTVFTALVVSLPLCILTWHVFPPTIKTSHTRHILHEVITPPTAPIEETEPGGAKDVGPSMAQVVQDVNSILHEFGEGKL